MERIIVQYKDDSDKIVWSQAPEIPDNYNLFGWLDHLKDEVRSGTVNFGATNITFLAYVNGDLQFAINQPIDTV